MMRKSSATQRTYRGIYERFAGWLSEHVDAAPASVDAFTPEALVDYLDGLERRCSASTVNKERAALRKLARYLLPGRADRRDRDLDGRDPDRP